MKKQNGKSGQTQKQIIFQMIERNMRRKKQFEMRLKMCENFHPIRTENKLSSMSTMVSKNDRKLEIRDEK